MKEKGEPGQNGEGVQVDAEVEAKREQLRERLAELRGEVDAQLLAAGVDRFGAPSAEPIAISIEVAAPAVEWTKETVAAAIEANTATLQRLGQLGVQLPMDLITRLVVSELLTWVLGDEDAHERQQFEGHVATKFAEHLGEIESHRRQATLLQGVQGIDLSKLRNPENGRG